MTYKMEKSKFAPLASNPGIELPADDLNNNLDMYTPSLPSNNSTEVFESQEDNSQISEFSENLEIINDFRPKKLYSVLLAQSYKRIAFKYRESDVLPINQTFYNKGERVQNCGGFLKFGQNIRNGVIEDRRYLHKALFCTDRLCPMCEWRRSRKIFAQVYQISENLIGNYNYKFALLTLTVKNVKAEELKETIDKMFYAYKKFALYKNFKKVVRGSFRRLEVTYNNKKSSPAYDTFHPHFHVLLALDHDYARKGYDYINRNEWLQMWQQAYGDYSITQVDIRMIDLQGNKYDQAFEKGKKAFNPLAKAVAEVAKYTCKYDNYLFPEDEGKTDYVVYTLSKALKGRKLTRFDGKMLAIWKQMKFEDMESENADLIHGEGEGLDPELDWYITSYYWKGTDYKLEEQYILTVAERQKERELASGFG